MSKIRIEGTVLSEPDRTGLDATIGVRVDAEGDIHITNDQDDLCISPEMWDALVNAVVDLLEHYVEVEEGEESADE